MSKHIFLALVVGIVALFAVSGTAMAGTTGDTLDVQATVVAGGRISSVTDINFGNYDPTSLTALDTTAATQGNIDVVVTNGVAYSIIISDPPREMTGPGGNLTYDLFTDSPGGTPWPSSGASVGATSTSLTPVSYPVHGRIPASQNFTTGVYLQTVAVTLTF